MRLSVKKAASSWSIRGRVDSALAQRSAPCLHVMPAGRWWPRPICHLNWHSYLLVCPFLVLSLSQGQRWQSRDANGLRLPPCIATSPPYRPYPPYPPYSSYRHQLPASTPAHQHQRTPPSRPTPPLRQLLPSSCASPLRPQQPWQLHISPPPHQLQQPLTPPGLHHLPPNNLHPPAPTKQPLPNSPHPTANTQQPFLFTHPPLAPTNGTPLGAWLVPSPARASRPVHRLPLPMSPYPTAPPLHLHRPSLRVPQQRTAHRLALALGWSHRLPGPQGRSTACPYP